MVEKMCDVFKHARSELAVFSRFRVQSIGRLMHAITRLRSFVPSPLPNVHIPDAKLVLVLASASCAAFAVRYIFTFVIISSLPLHGTVGLLISHAIAFHW